MVRGTDDGTEVLLDERVARLETLFQEHHRRVFRAALRVTGSPTDAEDVLQTVFSRLLKQMPDEDLGRGWGAYLHRSGVNAGVDLLRARTRRRWSPMDEMEVEPVDPKRSPEAAAGLNERKLELRRALSAESPRAAEIFALRYFEGYRNSEIAELIGISRTAVAVTLHRVRARLTKKLGADS